jgi:hypothetical protein
MPSLPTVTRVFVAVLLVGCGTPPLSLPSADVPGTLDRATEGDVPLDGSALDRLAAVDASPPVDIYLPECTGPAGCDDHSACTDDACVQGACVYTPVNSRCSDSIACTDDACVAGVCQHTAVPARCLAGQMCDVMNGCQGGRICGVDMDCVDADPCTTRERCDPGSRVCQFLPLDGDNDGHPPRVCGGDDCDDSRSSIHPGTMESCNRVDDNCNGAVDEAPAGTECGSGFICSSGNCACPTGRQACFSACLDLQTSRSDCGSCGRSCGTTGTCVGGNCVCLAGTTFCEGLGCIRVQDDDRNCGGCGVSCVGDLRCTTGTCACAAGRTACGTRCVDVLTDPTNCGRCGAGCAGDLRCQSGTCRCPGGQTACGERCVDLSSDESNCGTCSNQCPTDSLCLGGTCQCQAPLTLICGSSGTRQCVNALEDVDNCGACGRSCSDFNGTPACTTGACSITCYVGTDDCDHSVTNGCETSLVTTTNCGRCGNACPTVTASHASSACRAGACAAVCDSGWGDCNGDMSDGCEVDLTTSISNCGTCGNRCGNDLDIQDCQSARCCAPQSHTCGFGGASPCCSGLRCRSHGGWSQCDP